MKKSALSLREKIRLAPWMYIVSGVVFAAAFYSFGVSYPFRPFFLFFVIPTMIVSMINLQCDESQVVVQYFIGSIVLVFIGVLFPVVVQSFSVENLPQGFGWYVDCEPLVKALHYLCVVTAAWLSVEGYISIPVKSGAKGERREDDNDL